MKLSPLNQRRFALFKAHKRGWWSLWLFLVLFGLSLGAELIANDKPIVIRYDGGWYFPVFERYPETTFGGEFPLQANYKSPYIQELIAEKDGWMVWPPIPFDYSAINCLPVDDAFVGSVHAALRGCGRCCVRCCRGSHRCVHFLQ